MSNLTNTKNVVNAIRYAVKTRGYWVTFVKENNITRDSDIAGIARELATLAYPKDEPVQKKDGKRTRFGNAVQAAGNGIRSVLDKADDNQTKPDYLALAVQAARTAHTKGEVSVDDILTAVTAALVTAD